MKLSEKNYAHVESLRSMLINDITEYLQQHHNEIEVLVQGDTMMNIFHTSTPQSKLQVVI